MSVVRNMCALFAITLATSACLPRNAFAPPPDNWEMWTRPNTAEKTIWTDLMECGYSHPLTQMLNNNGKTLNDMVGSMMCMEKLGYTYREARRGKSVCDLKAWKRLGEAACLRGEGVPTPSSERRLNSDYCKKYTKSSICVQDSLGQTTNRQSSLSK